MDRLRLSEFAKFVGQDRTAVRNLIARNEAPFEKDREGEKQRTYDGADLLAYCIYVSLRRVGLQSRVAGEIVRSSGVAAQFLAAMDRGEDVSQLHLIAYATRRDRGERGTIDFPGGLLGTPSDLAEILQREADGYGQPDLSGRTRLGVSWQIALPILPCLDRCIKTADAYGFEMRGADLFEKTGPALFGADEV